MIKCLQFWNLNINYLGSFTVVRLLLSKSTSLTPVTGVTLGCGSNLSSRSRPEPTIHIGRLEIWAIAAVEVAFTSWCPDVTYITWNIVCSQSSYLGLRLSFVGYPHNFKISWQLTIFSHILLCFDDSQRLMIIEY